MYGNEVNTGKEISDMQESSFTKHYNMRVYYNLIWSVIHILTIKTKVTIFKKRYLMEWLHQHPTSISRFQWKLVTYVSFVLWCGKHSPLYIKLALKRNPS
jgi:hypothetical protein